jgi:uracil-DNA glycosylase family 4
MTMSSRQILHEMGLSPIWVLRGGAGEVLSAPLSPSSQEATEVESSAEPALALAPVLPVLGIDTPPLAPSHGKIAELDWDGLATVVSDCRACGLCEQRRQAVLGVGDKVANWLFIGEGPGAEEDARGEPFVGPAGQLLDAMLAAINLARGQDVYIANTVKCRPPSNRTPEAPEMAACRPYLERQIALIQPRLIVLLGRAAAHSVLGKDESLASLRGKTFEYLDGERRIPVVVSYHPAYLLRNLPDKAKAWEDLCRARALLGAAGQLPADVLAN